MDLIERLGQYKRLATIMEKKGDPESASAIRSMCEVDAALSDDQPRHDQTLHEAYARAYILSIGKYNRPGVFDSSSELLRKAADILLDVRLFEALEIDRPPRGQIGVSREEQKARGIG